jgi:hypothetical protein
MTYAINFVTVADSISKMSISGVTVKDIDQITASRMGQAAMLAPRPDNFVTNIQVARDELTGQKLTLKYTLNYTYYHCPVGSTLNFADYANLITNVAAILAVMVAPTPLAGSLDTEAPTVFEIGPVLDPAGNAFHGCQISLTISQFIN